MKIRINRLATRNLFLHTFDFLTLYANIAYVNFKIVCMHIARQIYVKYKKKLTSDTQINECVL